MQMRTDADLLELFAPGTGRDDDGGLRIAGCRVDELAATYGTPLLLVDEGHLRATVRAWKAGLESRRPGSRVTFASKAFPCTAVYRLMAEEGIGVDVAGGGELAQALAGGVDPARIILHGNAKTDAEIGAAHAAGVGLVVVDNLDDLDRLERLVTREQGVLVRITPGVEGETHASISTGGLDAKFGLPIDQAAAALRRAASHPLLRVDGVHIHIGSQILEAGPFAESVRTLAALLDAEGLGPFAVYDLGGGLGVRYTYDDSPAALDTYLDALLDAAARAAAGRRARDPRTGPRVGGPERRDRLPRRHAQAHRTRLRRRRRRHGRQPRGGAVRPAVRDRPRGAAARGRRDRLRRGRPAVRVGRPAGGGRAAARSRPSATCSPCRSRAPTASRWPTTTTARLRLPVVFARDGGHRAVVRRETYADLMARDLHP